jgi:Subtilase family
MRRTMILALTLGLAAEAAAQVQQGPVPGTPAPSSGGGGIGGMGFGLSINLGGKKKYEAFDERDEALPDQVANQVIFVIQGPNSDAARIAKEAKVTVIEVTRLPSIARGMVVAELAPGDTVELAIARLKLISGVTWALPNHIYQTMGRSAALPRRFALHGFPSDPAFRVSGTIAMIDTPIALEHEALKDAHITQYVVGASQTAGVHGTAIASLLVGGGQVPGVARSASLLSFAAFSEDRTGNATSQTRYLAKAFDSAVRARPNVLNLSFGGRDDRLLSYLLDEAMHQGICVVAAAGNGGANGAVPFPATHRASLAVTAVDERLRPYANASHGNRIDVSAQGVGLIAAVPRGYRSVSGTSFSTAVAAGGLMHIRACSTDHDATAMHYGATAMAQDLGVPGPDPVFGAGLFKLDGKGAK